MKCFAVGALAAVAVADKPDYEGMWLQFKSDYNKDYNGNNDDEQKRFKIFKANVDIIEEHNVKKLSYWLGVNEFADQTWEEFSSTHLGYKAETTGLGTKVPFPNITDVADSIDWVAKGAVTPVKDQQRCGSCWAFSSTGALEGAFFVASGKLVSLSEEDLVQCNSVTDHGCQGGLMDNAFKWVEQNGICSESAYPYTSGGGVTGSCKKGCSPVVGITGYTDVPSKNEDALKAAVSKQPVSVAIEADKSAFQLYKGGILDNSACGTNLDHGVLAVGYGTDGKDYWKVKNSWGASWGEQGYIRMVRNKNQCGISQQPSYPTGAKAAGPVPPPGPAPTPAPTPAPAPPSPPVKGDHYGNPANGCLSDEDTYTPPSGIAGAVCGHNSMDESACPEPPAGVTAKAGSLKIVDASGQVMDAHCVLQCSVIKPGCPKGAQCKGIGVLKPFRGMCTYPSSEESVVV